MKTWLPLFKIFKLLDAILLSIPWVVRCLSTGLDRSQKVRLNSLNLVNRHHFQKCSWQWKNETFETEWKKGKWIEWNLKGRQLYRCQKAFTFQRETSITNGFHFYRVPCQQKSILQITLMNRTWLNMQVMISISLWKLGFSWKASWRGEFFSMYPSPTSY